MKKRCGFTLLELLLVIGVIGILLAALMPAISGARESSLSALCASRLHNLAIHAQQYAMECGYYPWGSINPSSHDADYAEKFDGTLYPLESNIPDGAQSWNEFETFCWDFYKKNGEVGWNSGVMFGVGKKASSVLGCPKCSNCTDNWDGNPSTGYNYNVCYLGYVEGDSGKRKYPLAYSKIKNPEKVVIFGDGGYAGGPNKFMRAPMQDKQYDGSSASLRKAGTQAFRHGRGKNRHCNMAFADGHVEKFYTPYKAGGKEGWVDEKTYSAFISSGNGIYGPRGWGVEDDDTEGN